MSNINFSLMVNELSLKNNNLPHDEYTITPLFSRRIQILEDHVGVVQLRIEIKNTDETPFPMDLVVDLSGRFQMEDIHQEQIEEFLKFQAVRILLPYLRSMVTNLTSTALAAPILLPLMDPVEMFKE